MLGTIRHVISTGHGKSTKVAVTASIRPEDELQALDAGCSGFISKPIDINELPKQVAIHIARASSTD